MTQIVEHEAHAATPSTADRARQRPGVPVAVLTLPCVIIVLTLIGGVTTDGFLTGNGLRAVLLSASITGIVAVAMTPMTMSGSFVSLAIAQSTALAGVGFSAMIGAGWSPALAIALTIAGLLVTGVVQAIVIAAGLNPIITTLAAASVMAGGVSVAAGSAGTLVSFNDHSVPWLTDTQPLGLPLPIYFFLAVTVIVTFIAHGTVVGRRILLTGANRETAAVSGISVRRVILAVFAIFSVGVAIAGILAASRVGGANGTMLPDLTIDAIAALLVGGTAMQGGAGSPLRTAAGAVVIALIDTLMIMHNFSDGGRMAVKGALVLLVIFVVVGGQHRNAR